MKTKFDKEGRQLFPTRGVPAKLLGAITPLVWSGDWTTDQIRGACDVLDEWAGEKRGRGERGFGKQHDDDEKAVQMMLMICHRSGETSPRALAKEALKLGLGDKGNSPEANIQRLAAALRASAWFRGFKNKSR